MRSRKEDGGRVRPGVQRSCSQISGVRSRVSKGQYQRHSVKGGSERVGRPWPEKVRGGTSKRKGNILGKGGVGVWGPKNPPPTPTKLLVFLGGWVLFFGNPHPSTSPQPPTIFFVVGVWGFVFFLFYPTPHPPPTKDKNPPPPPPPPTKPPTPHPNQKKIPRRPLN